MLDSGGGGLVVGGGRIHWAWKRQGGRRTRRRRRKKRRRKGGRRTWHILIKIKGTNGHSQREGGNANWGGGQLLPLPLTQKASGLPIRQSLVDGLGEGQRPTDGQTDDPFSNFGKKWLNWGGARKGKGRGGNEELRVV